MIDGCQKQYYSCAGEVAGSERAEIGIVIKWTLKLLAIVLVLVVAGAGAGWLYLRSSLPPLDGHWQIDGLDGQVAILRDRNAVVHIEATSPGDAYFALGVAHAQDRLAQMEFARRVGAGRLAELRFLGGFGLQTDRFMRTLGLYRSAEASYSALSAETREALDRYADGVNWWIENRTGALPPEFAILGVEPEPWKPADSIVWGKVMSLQLSGNFRRELMRARLSARLPVGKIDVLLPPTGLATDAAVPASILPILDRVADALPPPLGPSTASNEWVLGGSRTATGAPILVNDPHLRLDAPSLWYLVSLSTPGWSVRGATTPGTPLVILGQNDRLAWGLTTTEGDVQDLFIERLDPTDPNRYLTPDGWVDMETRDEIIRVRGHDDLRLTVRSTRHGPVISDVRAEIAAIAGQDHAVSLAFTALVDEDRSADALMRLNRARSVEEAIDALSLWIGPPQNVALADRAGRIAIVPAGRYPLRKSGDGRHPTPGWTGETDWIGTIPWDSMPRLVDPRSDVLVNANEPVVGSEYPLPFVDGGDARYRADRIAEMIKEAGDRLTVEDGEAMLADTVTLDARALVPILLAASPGIAPRSAEARALLAEWDFRMDRNLPQPLVFMEWLSTLGPALVEDELGPLAEVYGTPGPDVILRILNRETEWCDNVDSAEVEGCEAVVSGTFDTAVEELSERFGTNLSAWRWGDEHVAPMTATVLGRVPVLGALASLAVETDGGPYTVNRGATSLYDETAPFRHVHGAGYRGIYDLADPRRSRFVISTGQSGHPMSPHWGDFVERWRSGSHVAIATDPDDVRAEAIGEIVLSPAP